MSEKETAGKVIEMGLEAELSGSYGRYAHTIILERAIPDARDGLKPVQRRILYAMARSKNTADKPYRKSAKTVGDVMGNFHPHGDQSIYHALVRMTQVWKMRLPLVDGHGNFGSIDDDPPAAMRYTEARLAKAADELLADIEKDTVAFQPNFDESEEEPTVLPAAFPNLLVNGASGVSTGFATEIPPHCLREVVDAVCLRMDNPRSSLDEIMSVLPGPDFPTGGILLGEEGLRQAYETGRGRVMVRARHTTEKGEAGRTLIVVNELPYGVIKSNLVRELDSMRQNKAVQGIADVRDESDREGLRVVIELARAADVDGVWNFLLKKTSLQVYYSFNMVAIHRHRPIEAGLIELLDAYVGHRREVLRRRSEHDLARAQARLHVVEGLIRAVDILDEVIATIRASKDRANARDNLVARFAFTEVQADAILDLRLHRLTGLQLLQLQEEAAALAKEIAGLEKLLASPKRLDAAIQKELREVAERHGDARRTEIRAEVESLNVALEVRVKPQSIVVAVTDRGYIKRSSLQSYQASGAIPENAGVREDDIPRFVLETNTIHRALVFTASGTVFSIPAHTLPEARWTDPGTALVNVVPFDMTADRVVGVFAPESYRGEAAFLFVTAKGFVKRSLVGEFDLRRSGGAVALKLAEGDRLVSVLDAPGGTDAILATREGQQIRFPVDQVSLQGRSARGVRGLGLNRGDEVAAATMVPHVPEGAPEGALAILTVGGKGKQSPLAEFPCQHRGGKGVRGLIKRGKRPHVVLAIGPVEGFSLLAFPKGGEPFRFSPSELRSTHRDGNGFQIPGLPEGGELRAVIGLPLAKADEEAQPEVDPEPGDVVEAAEPSIAGADQLSLLP